ncbi:MAG TPA: hypothetical protein VEQ63_06945, partial [Bryobacteraceae bacterium]|nr:hypothetical protein [Bryobacteraceae bacterium]
MIRIASVGLLLAVGVFAAAPNRTLSAGKAMSSVPGFFIRTGTGDWELRGSRTPVSVSHRGVAIGPVHLDLLGAAQVQPEAQEPGGLLRHYSQSPGTAGTFSLQTSLLFPEVYPGISLKLSAEGNLFKSEYLLQPRADFRRIRFQYAGARSVKLEAGGLVIECRDGSVLHEPAPYAYQQVDGEKREVGARYLLHPDRTISFHLDTYNVDLPTVIDPYILSTGAFHGGTGIDQITGIAVDASGVYLSGWTESFDFPAQSLRARSTGVDAFVMKLNPQATQVLWATYVGGSLDDRALTIGVDSSQQVRVGGWTISPDFPTSSAQQPNSGGGRDGWIARLSSTGAIVFSSYIGGSGTDEVTALAVSSAGDTWITGETDSVNFPKVAPYQQTLRGSSDAFLARFTPAGTIGYSSYLGGSGHDRAQAIAVDGTGAAYVAGGTYSGNFPQVNALQSY